MRAWIHRTFYIWVAVSEVFSQSAPIGEIPKLVVGIVVDQMRQEYLYRFYPRFGSGGFRRLMDKGFMLTDMHYNYVPTFTGPGHASIYSGTTPRFHGIIANEWYIRNSKKVVYCVDDENASSVPAGYKDGKKSPHRLWCTNLADELKFMHPRAKVFSLSLKDRSAILPAGHKADGVFWMDDSSGHFISSDYYTSILPEWISSFNRKFSLYSYLKYGWSTLYSLNTYTASLPDDFPYERSPFGGKAVFPYVFDASVARAKYLKYLPQGNNILRHLAMQAVTREQLGKDEVPDLLMISFSAPDYVGHLFGPRSVELEDMYLRLDRELDTLLTFLDKKVGAGQFIVFLTADHGCSENTGFLRMNRIPSGNLTEKKLEDTLRKFFQREFQHPEWMEKVSNFLIYLNVPEDYLNKILQKTKTYLLSLNGISEVYECHRMVSVHAPTNDPESLNKMGYTMKAEADLVYTPSPGWLDYDINGTTHGVCYSTDTHVPMLWSGHRIRPGKSSRKRYITQIVPTLQKILKISLPSCASDESLEEIMKFYEP